MKNVIKGRPVVWHLPLWLCLSVEYRAYYWHSYYSLIYIMKTIKVDTYKENKTDQICDKIRK